jgi:AraC family transcriptional regulator
MTLEVPLVIAGVIGPFETRRDISDQWRFFDSLRHEIPGQIEGYCYGVVLESNEYLAGVAIDAPESKVPKNFATIRLPAQTYEVFRHRGPLRTLAATIEEIRRQCSSTSPEIRSIVKVLDPLPPGASIEIWIPAS